MLPAGACAQEGVNRRNLHIFCRLLPGQAGLPDDPADIPAELHGVLPKGQATRKNSNRKILRTISSGNAPACPGERGTGKFRGSGAVRSGRGKSPAPPSATPRETATGLCYKAPRTYREYGEKATTALLQINDKAWKEYTWTKIM